MILKSKKDHWCTIWFKPRDKTWSAKDTLWKPGAIRCIKPIFYLMGHAEIRRQQLKDRGPSWAWFHRSGANNLQLMVNITVQASQTRYGSNDIDVWFHWITPSWTLSHQPRTWPGNSQLLIAMNDLTIRIGLKRINEQWQASGPGRNNESLFRSGNQTYRQNHAAQT